MSVKSELKNEEYLLRIFCTFNTSLFPTLASSYASRLHVIASSLSGDEWHSVILSGISVSFSLGTRLFMLLNLV